MQDQSEQFLAFSMGYMSHLATDTVAHSFVNEQCGGPYRNHPQRHHLIENHIDSFNYVQTGPGGRLTPDPFGVTNEYPSVSLSALWFAIQFTPEIRTASSGLRVRSPTTPTGRASSTSTGRCRTGCQTPSSWR